MPGFDVDTDGREVVDAGRLLAGEDISLVEAVRILGESTVFLQRPDTEFAQLNVLTVADEQWVLAFSALNRLVKAFGPSEWIALLGDDLMDNMPAGVNLGIDLQDDTSFFVPAPLIAARKYTNGVGAP
ncbi:hypothetical protein ACWDTI_20890 [Gordonia sp. NPDC003424]